MSVAAAEQVASVAEPATVENNRTQYWVLPKLQKRFIAWLVGVSAVVSTTVAWAVLLVVWSPLGSQLAWAGANVNPEKLFWDACVRVLITTVLLVAIFGLVALLAGLLMSHRVAGPLHRLGSVACQVSQGQYRQRVTLRRGDYIQEFAGTFNGMLDHVEERIRGQQSTLTGVYARLTELEMALAEGAITPQECETRLQETLRMIRDSRVGDLAEETPYT